MKRQGTILTFFAVVALLAVMRFVPPTSSDEPKPKQTVRADQSAQNPSPMTEEQQIQAALLAAGGLAGEAAACNFSDRTDYHIAFAFMETLRKRWPEMINKATEAFATGYGSAFGAVTKDRNFPSVCATQVKEFLNGETARDVRAFLIQRTKP